jgi:hypothetical protein
VRFLQSPAGKAAMGGLGLLVTLVAAQKVRQRRKSRRTVVRRTR